MQFAVTGVTSGVGRRFAEMALAQGHQVRGLVRSPQRDDARALAALGVEVVAGTLHNVAALSELCAGADVAVHMAAHVGDWGDRALFEQVNVQGTQLTVEAAARARVKRFVQLSSTAVYGRPQRGRVTEDWPMKRCGAPYDDTKTEAEQLAFKRGQALGLEVTAVRPPIIYGPYDRNFIPRTLRMLNNRAMVLIDGGHTPLNVVWVDHVVDVLLLTAHHPAACGETFNVMDCVSDKPPSVREIVTTIADAAALPRPRLSVPANVATPIAAALERAYRLLNAKTPPPATPFVVRLMTLEVIYDASKAARLLGWKSRLKPLVGVARYARQLVTKMGV
ncbi:MAG TPA: NAD-dependent epimerase/dehydratase family protein [Sorangium sp.]|nr:NAD-dependent epimerase/dehydratase family protein [Sorangium sp.]